jgi:hypothetical protein
VQNAALQILTGQNIYFQFFAGQKLYFRLLQDRLFISGYNNVEFGGHARLLSDPSKLQFAFFATE